MSFSPVDDAGDTLITSLVGFTPVNVTAACAPMPESNQNSARIAAQDPAERLDFLMLEECKVIPGIFIIDQLIYKFNKIPAHYFTGFIAVLPLSLFFVFLKVLTGALLCGFVSNFCSYICIIYPRGDI